MELYEKILSLYPTLNVKFFSMPQFVVLQNNSDGTPTFLASWNHPSLPEPTEEQLSAVTTKPTIEQLTWDDTWLV